MEGFPKVGDVLVWTEPPDGYHVNFTNPQKDTVLLHASLGVSISCVISLLLTGINLYVAFLVTKKPFPQHFLALAGCVLVAASQSIIFVCQMRGVLGVHVWEMPLDHARWESTLLLAANLLAIPATALAKSGLYVFYHEVIGVTPRAYFILIPAAFSIVAFVVMWIIQLFACTPIQAAWNLTYYTETSCHSRYYCGTAQASVGILADLCITSLALFRTFQLQMPIRGKLEVLSYFFSSLVTLVPAALRLHISVSGHEKENHDPTWDLFWMATYWLYEANCAIICYSLPGLRHLIRSFRKPAPLANCNDSHTPSYSSPPYFNIKLGQDNSSEVELYPSMIQGTRGDDP